MCPKPPKDLLTAIPLFQSVDREIARNTSLFTSATGQYGLSFKNCKIPSRETKEWSHPISIINPYNQIALAANLAYCTNEASSVTPRIGVFEKHNTEMVQIVPQYKL
jgi:hypothetical protein